MKYRIKYLIKSYEINSYNIDKSEINNKYEIEIDISANDNYIYGIYVERKGEYYIGLSEESFIKYMNEYKYDYKYHNNKNNIKLIKDLIIKEIIE